MNILTAIRARLMPPPQRVIDQETDMALTGWINNARAIADLERRNEELDGALSDQLYTARAEFDFVELAAFLESL